MFSVIVPLYNEGARVLDLLAHLAGVAGVAEVVLADASDEPESLAVLEDIKKHGAGDLRINLVQLLRCEKRGRAAQMNAGVAACGGDVLVFLHCDTRLPKNAAHNISQCIARGGQWGWFDLRLDARGLMFRVLERMINLRARLSRIATGDQAIFITRKTFPNFADIPLMEDVEISRRLKRCATSTVIKVPVTTSARRWQQNGITRTVLLMWRLRFLFWLGVSAQRLAGSYQNVR